MRVFVYPRRVAYHETDAMGVVHHSNHVKYFEEARVEWLRARGVMSHHQPYGPYIFAVTHQEARYFRPAVFDEDLEVWVQTRMQGARVLFQYALYSSRQKAVIADGRTTLVPIKEKSFRAVKLPPEVLSVYANEPWDEQWPPSGIQVSPPPSPASART